MLLASPIAPLADLIADLLRRTADAISPPRPAQPPALTGPRLTLVPPPPPRPPRDPERERAMLSAEFRNRLPAYLRRDIGIDY